MTILSDVKPALGIDPNNLSFDQELLMHINGIALELSQNGVPELSESEITAETDWPIFETPAISGAVKPFIALRLRRVFDPTASETINKIFTDSANDLVGRIAHEMEEINDAEV